MKFAATSALATWVLIYCSTSAAIIAAIILVAVWLFLRSPDATSGICSRRRDRARREWESKHGADPT